ncbi:fumarylacetoacetate (FAA) hydrolase [Comamonas sp. BIGb0152]|uniref:fumarylacetoacetate hydrolase family protein n=1 Tax=Comamonas sp. BIGb0152 TaxID=2940601 RepID=UPI002168568D|nr:fumarylacetoacetate hydrolase family protein [Comamonas sp. BIGb0152]MCS4295850.1 fumarylacetoacetate (FAA) hydrolase [Comamonas sp. BIGb0152]
MKLASYKDGSRDGQLVVVSRDLRTAHYASGIAHRLQQVLDDWDFYAPQLQDLYDALNADRARHSFDFNPVQCMAPLPRAYQWLSGAAYLNQLSVLRQLPQADLPAALKTDPLIHQGGSDAFIGPCDDIVVASEAMGIDFSAELAVITSDVKQDSSPEDALDSVRLLMLANPVSLRQLQAAEQDKGAGLVQSKPVTAFSPVAITPDELGDAWRGGRVHLALQTSWNGRKVGMCDAGPEMAFHFGQLIAHAAKTRNLRAGTVLGSGTISNSGAEKHGRMDWPKGYGCIAEKRSMEAMQNSKAKTGFMQFGDTVRIEMKGKDGNSLFGAIDQSLAPLYPAQADAVPAQESVA